MRKEWWWCIALLTFAPGKINRLSKQSARRSCLEATNFKPKLLQIIAKGGRRFPHTPPCLGLHSNMEKPSHEGSCCDNHARCQKANSQIGLYSCYAITTH